MAVTCSSLFNAILEAKIIRALPELNGLPIIALTAGAFKTHRIAALDAEMDDFVAKPFDVDELITCIERQVHRTLGKHANTLPILQSPTIEIDTIANRQ